LDNSSVSNANGELFLESVINNDTSSCHSNLQICDLAQEPFIDHDAQIIHDIDLFQVPLVDHGEDAQIIHDMNKNKNTNAIDKENIQEKNKNIKDAKSTRKDAKGTMIEKENKNENKMKNDKNEKEIQNDKNDKHILNNNIIFHQDNNIYMDHSMFTTSTYLLDDEVFYLKKMKVLIFQIKTPYFNMKIIF
jgi:hypothetical protein